MPTEKDKSTLPTYIIEPPDILLIDAVKLVPKAPYHIEPLDVLQIQVANPLIDQPIAGPYPVDPGGAVDLGPAYGKVLVEGQTVDEAQHTIETHLKSILRDPQVSVSLAQSSGQQQIAGEHLVGPDGTVNLGTYGTVYVAGMTIAEAKDAIEAAAVELPGTAAGVGRHLRLQQQGLLRDHRRGRLRRHAGPACRSPATKRCSTRWPRSTG